MTKRDLFKIAIRLFALLAAVSSLFQTLPTMLQFNFQYFELIPVAIALIIVALIIMFFRLLFLYTDKIIDWFRLVQGFDDDKIILGESSLSTLIKLALILFGVYILVINVLSLLADIYYWFSSKVNASPDIVGLDEFKAIDWYYYISNIIIAFLFLFYNQLLTDKILEFGSVEHPES